MKTIAHIKENPIVYATAALVVSVLGGSVAITLPADVKIAALRSEFVLSEQRIAQNQQQQDTYHTKRELDDVRFRMKYLSNEVNRLNMLPSYLNRPLTEQEQWQLQQVKEEWNLLKQREQELSK